MSDSEILRAMSIFDEAAKRARGFDPVAFSDMYTFDDGSVLVYRRSDLVVDMPVNCAPVFNPPRVEFNMLQRFGGVGVRPVDRIVQILPAPDMQCGLPGVEAMLANDWAWDGWREVFVRDGGSVSLARVQSGRYAERLPTNRKRTRERRKNLAHATAPGEDAHVVASALASALTRAAGLT